MRTFALLLLAWTVIGCKGGDGTRRLPEDQRIEGPIHITTEWQTLHFDPPLAINRGGLQALHFVVDEQRYAPNSNFDIEDMANHFNLRRDDGVLVQPQVLFIGNDGRVVPVTATRNILLYAGGLTIGFGSYAGHYAPAPPFPAGIESFTAARVRSNVPFTADYLQWWVDVVFPPKP